MDEMLQRSAGAFQPRQGEQTAGHRIQPPRFLLDAVEGGHRALGLLPGQGDGQLQAGERRSQFMRHVIDELAARQHKLLDLFGHAVEIAGEIRDLVAAAPHARGQTHPQIAARKALQPSRRARIGSAR